MKRVACLGLFMLLASVPVLAVKICPPPHDLEPANDPTYGYSKKNPIVVGHIGPKNLATYMGLLRGPNGEELTYKRAGSCCTFRTNQALVGDEATLEKYKVSYKGKKAVMLYVNQYDCEKAKIPDGFTAR